MSESTTNIEDSEKWADLDLNDTALQNLLDNPVDEPDTSKLRDGEQHVGFDNNMGETWIYPNNLPCRSYQMSIVQAALYRNTLVVLPTGLGKTFIAAVVMYNFYRWYPRGKLIFMAPTRPLVNQQIEACQKIMPFPRKDTIELTGKLQKARRTEMWKTKRVFFATPQVVQSDILGGRPQEADSVDEASFQDEVPSSSTSFPFDLVKLVVIDEAHKAKGKYAYTEVTQALARNSKYFRVLALSATPGRTVDDVAEVCRNLLISHLEVRWDTSIDVLPYVHKRSMNTVVVSIDDRITEIREQLLAIVDPYLRQLIEAQMLSGSLTNINRNFLLYEQKRYRDRSFQMGRHAQHSAITSNFAICISLYHALELLERHGLRVFLNNFEEDEDGKNKFVLQLDRRLRDLVEKLRNEMGPNPFEVSAEPMTNCKIAEIPKNLDFGHPKFEKTRECLLTHFESNKDSRAIVFCEYRESVMLIHRMLLQHLPLLRPRCFVGQGGTGSLRALTQKQQIQIMNDFRAGRSNILIATSIAEEGIDVGEVELIVCFDISTSNPTRFVQRIGRTGRKQNGHVVMMVTEGREQQLLCEVLANKDQINKKILKSSVVQQSLYQHAPRLVPTEFKPKCVQTYIKAPSDDEDIPSTKYKKLTNKQKSPEEGVQDLRKFFETKTKNPDKEDLEFFENEATTTQAKPGLQTQQKMIKKLDDMRNLFKDLQSSLATQTQKSTKKSQSKLDSSQGSITDFFKNVSPKTKTNTALNKSLNESQASLKDLNNLTIDLCDNDSDNSQSDALDDLPGPSKKAIAQEHLKALRKFFKTNLNKPELIKMAEINDLGYHIKSNDLSREMNKLMLKMKPDYIKENLEKMKILSAVYDSETANYSEEEMSIREINSLILDLFGGEEELENYLESLAFGKYKQQCWASDSESGEEDSEEMEKLQRQMIQMFKDYADDERDDIYEWIQECLKDAPVQQKLNTKFQEQTQQQESMVYEACAEPEDDHNFDTFDDGSITESKYRSEWPPEFNKIGKDFKSTPIPGTSVRTLQSGSSIARTSLLSKLEESEENLEIIKQTLEAPSTSAKSKQLQNMLLLLAKQLNKSSLNETKTSTNQDDLAESENVFVEKRIAEAESNISNKSDYEDFNLPDDDDLLKAADEAEMIFVQNQTREAKCPSLPNLAATSSSALMPTSSSHRTPDEPTLARSLPTPALSYLRQELDLDMETFFQPFPEQQELVRSTHKNLMTPAIARESPDLFADEHIRTPIRKPIAYKGSPLALALTAQRSLNECESSSNPTNPLELPQKPLPSPQNPKEQQTSPTSRLPIDKQKYEKSPSLFDMYLKNTKGRGKLPKQFADSGSISPALKPESSVNPASQQNESVVVVRRSKRDAISKRRIFDSDPEQEENDNKPSTSIAALRLKPANDSDTEEVAATQGRSESSIIERRKKRRRINCFIEEEAAVSGSDDSEDDAEHNTVGGYVLDSLLVSSDDEDPDQASTSHMQAVYLQSLKSPPQRQGTFKIPAPRVYNDQTHIFSQAVLPDDIQSQYLSDSFVVDEDSSCVDANEVTMCPLEKAEQILKERKRAKMLQRKKKIQLLDDSSEDDDDDDDDDFE